MRMLFLPLLVLSMLISLAASPVFAQMAHDQNAAYADRTFLSAMIGHHQDAVTMSENALKNAKDPRVQALAKAVLVDQKKEIAGMEAMLKTMGGIDEKASATGKMDMSHPKSSDPDTAFVAGMLEHHKAALVMAGDALVHSRNPKVLDLAKDIIVKQAEEMRAYKSWLVEKS